MSQQARSHRTVLLAVQRSPTVANSGQTPISSATAFKPHNGCGDCGVIVAATAIVVCAGPRYVGFATYTTIDPSSRPHNRAPPIMGRTTTYRPQVPPPRPPLKSAQPTPPAVVRVPRRQPENIMYALGGKQVHSSLGSTYEVHSSPPSHLPQTN